MNAMTLGEWVESRRQSFLEQTQPGELLTAACCSGPLDDDGLPTYDRASRLLLGVIYWMANTSAGLKVGQAANTGAAKRAAKRAIREARQAIAP